MRFRQWQQGILIGVLLLIAFWIGSRIIGLIGKAHIAFSQAQEAKAQYAELEAHKTLLEANLSALESARGEDAAIRTAFGVARPGEEVIVLVPNPATTSASTSVPWWRKILNWF